MVHIKLALIYANTQITAATDDEVYTMLKKMLSQHECVIMGDFNLPNIDNNNNNNNFIETRLQGTIGK